MADQDLLIAGTAVPSVRLVQNSVERTNERTDTDGELDILTAIGELSFTI